MNGVAAANDSHFPKKRFRFYRAAYVVPALMAAAIPFCRAAHADPPGLKAPQSAGRHAPLPPADPPFSMRPLPQVSTLIGEPRVLFDRGIAYARLGDYTRAINAYTTALKSQSSDTAVLLARAQAFTSRANAAEQIKAADKALRAHPDDVHALLHRAFAYYNTGAYDKAIADYDVLLEEKPDYVAAYLGRALAHVADESWGDAAADYRRAFLLRPDLIPASREPSDYHLLVDRD